MNAERINAASLLIGPADASWGDERERGVMLEAYAYAYLLGSLLLWVILAVVAWFIPAWVSTIVLVALIIPSMEFQRYCKAREVDLNLLIFVRGSSTRRRIVIMVIYVVCVVSTVMAVTSSWNGPVSSAVVGGIVGAGGAYYMGRRKAVRTQARLDSEAEGEAPE